MKRENEKGPHHFNLTAQDPKKGNFGSGIGAPTRISTAPSFTSPLSSHLVTRRRAPHPISGAQSSSERVSDKHGKPPRHALVHVTKVHRSSTSSSAPTVPTRSPCAQCVRKSGQWARILTVQSWRHVTRHAGMRKHLFAVRYTAAQRDVDDTCRM